LPATCPPFRSDDSQDDLRQGDRDRRQSIAINRPRDRRINANPRRLGGRAAEGVNTAIVAVV
jgi:hypothetical protein